MKTKAGLPGWIPFVGFAGASRPLTLAVIAILFPLMRLPRRLVAFSIFLGVFQLHSLAASSLPYTTEVAFKLDFDQPVAMVTPPGEKNRLFVVKNRAGSW